MKQHMLTHKIRDMPQHVFGNSRQSSSPDNCVDTMKFSLSSNFQSRNAEDENESMSYEHDRHSNQSSEFIGSASRVSSRDCLSVSPVSESASPHVVSGSMENEKDAIATRSKETDHEKTLCKSMVYRPQNKTKFYYSLL